MKKLFEEITDLEQAPGVDTKSHIMVLANSTISIFFFQLQLANSTDICDVTKPSKNAYSVGERLSW